MRVLIACEFSGVVRDAFLALGHDAWSCDIVATGHPRHLQGNASIYLRQEWDLVIAHPPCTYLSILNFLFLGNRGTKGSNQQKRVDRLMKMHDAVGFFNECLNANAPMVCVENPKSHQEAKVAIGVECTQVIQPYEFGDCWSKATCLWLKGLPLLVPTNVIKPLGSIVPTVHPVGSKKKSNSKTMQKSKLGLGRMRSVFSAGIAEAMADQWGSLGPVAAPSLFSPTQVEE